MSSKQKMHYAFIILIAVSLIRGISGPAINASSGLFLSPVSSELGIGIGKLSLYLSISSVVTLFWLPIAGNLIKKMPVRRIALISVLLQTAAFMGLGAMTSVWGFYILSVPLAMGGALLVNLLGPILLNRWFASNIGLVMGVMMTITSLCGSLIQPLLSYFIENKGWRFTYIVFGAAALVGITLLITLLLKDKPEDIGAKPYTTAPKETVSRGNAGKSLASISAGEALKLPAFYLLLLYMIILTGLAAFSQHIATYGLDSGYTMTAIGTALSVSMLGSAVGSILIGFFSDRVGILATSIAVMAVGILSIGLFLVEGSIYWLFLLASFLFGLATSSIGVVAPLLVTEFFGTASYEKLFSYVMMGAPFASIILLPAYGFIYDSFKSYQFVFLFLIGAMIIASIGICAGHKNARRHRSEERK